MSQYTRYLDGAEHALSALRAVDSLIEGRQSLRTRLRRVDQALYGAVIDSQSPAGVTAAKVYTQLGTWTTQVAMVAAGAARARKHSDRRQLAFAATAILGTTVLNKSVKAVVQRGRPDPRLHLVHVGDSSFPSGHAATSAAAARVLAEWYGLPKSSMAALALGVALTRVYLGVHHPADVAVGFLIGWTWPSLVARVARSRGEAEPDAGTEAVLEPSVPGMVPQPRPARV